MGQNWIKLACNGITKLARLSIKPSTLLVSFKMLTRLKNFKRWTTFWRASCWNTWSVFDSYTFCTKSNLRPNPSHIHPAQQGWKALKLLKELVPRRVTCQLCNLSSCYSKSMAGCASCYQYLYNIYQYDWIWFTYLEGHHTDWRLGESLHFIDSRGQNS